MADYNKLDDLLGNKIDGVSVNQPEDDGALSPVRRPLGSVADPSEELSTAETDPSAFAPAVADNSADDNNLVDPKIPISKQDSDLMKSFPDGTEKRLPANQIPPTNAKASNDTSSDDRLKYLQDLLGSVKDLRSAQDNYKSQLRGLNGLQGANQIAQAFATRYGAKIGDGSEAIKSLKDSAYRPIEEIAENLKMGQEDVRAQNSSMELQRLLQAGDKTSSISQLARQQAATGMAMLTSKRGTPEFDAAVQKYLDQFKDMSALDLEKGAFGKTGLLGKTPTTAGFGMFIDAKTGHPLVSRSFMGQVELVDAQTNQVVDPNTVSVRPFTQLDPITGNRVYTTPNGMLPVNGAIPGASKQQANGTVDSEMQPQSTGDQPQKEYTMADLNKINPKFADKQITRIQEDANKDKVLQEAREMGMKNEILFRKLQGLDPMKPGEIDSGMAPSLASQMASMAQGGNSRIAAEFINKYNGAGGLAARLGRAIDNNLAGKLTKEDRDFFAEAGMAFQDAAESKYDKLATKYANRLQGLFPDQNVSTDNAKKILGFDKGLDLGSDSLNKFKSTVGTSVTPPTGQDDLVTIQGPSGQTVKMKKDVAQKYLSKPGYKLVQ